MRQFRILRVFKMVAIAIVAAAVVGLVTMRLWNWLMPAIFGLRMITFWQALGLFVLGKVLLGGFHRHGGGGGRGRGGRHMWERMEQMSPEERERFRAGIRGRHGYGFGHRDEPTAAETER